MRWSSRSSWYVVLTRLKSTAPGIAPVTCWSVPPRTEASANDYASSRRRASRWPTGGVAPASALAGLQTQQPAGQPRSATDPPGFTVDLNLCEELPVAQGLADRTVWLPVEARAGTALSSKVNRGLDPPVTSTSTMSSDLAHSSGSTGESGLPALAPGDRAAPSASQGERRWRPGPIPQT